jgi:hypothetical protein
MFQIILKAYQEVAVMYALGQKQTFATQKGMSALPPKADMCGATRCPLWGMSGHRLADHTSSATAVRLM